MTEKRVFMTKEERRLLKERDNEISSVEKKILFISKEEAELERKLYADLEKIVFPPM